MVKKFFAKAPFFLCFLAFTSCFQPSAEDHLQTVPATNNPNLIQDTTKSPLSRTGAEF